MIVVTCDRYAIVAAAPEPGRDSALPVAAFCNGRPVASDYLRIIQVPETTMLIPSLLQKGE